MSADIRLVKLRRRAINNSEALTRYQLPSDGMDALSMDYFDIISVKKFTSADSLEDIMDVGNVGLESRDDVSMQSYSLYCDEEVLLEHEKDLSYADPFAVSDQNNDMPFLSIIQVHITPEVLARVKDQSGSECVKSFFDDLHFILNDFVNHHNSSNRTLVYRIYQSLSAGDFAVVIRSDFADTSFYVSSLIRKRRVKTQTESEIPLVLYKTYTILSIYNAAKKISERSKASDNGLVIRCCFANRYWSEKARVDVELASVWNPDAVDSLRSLNGRYDFTVQLTENEFARILPVIGEFKGFSGYTSQTAVDDMKEKIKECQPFDIVDYLCYLIVNGYLSYVNERYLLHTDNVNGVSTESQIEIIPFTEKDKFLARVNEEKYHELEQKANELNVRVARINSYRKNMNYYFGLLQKLLHLCETINGLSDTRIYACMLLWQIECVLEGMDEYIAVMQQKKDSVILGGLEEFLQKSVCALDSFAQYIRNNNLQSLQTPNYSLQSSASMEKLLLGYGEFLDELIEGYRQSKFAEKLGELSGDFTPVLIPALQDGQLSIEIMFPDVFLFRQSQRRKLMVVKCSTLQDITDVSNMVVGCFHEIAHQFRYESRKKRNEVLVRYAAWVAFWPLAKKVSKELCCEVLGMNECREIENVLLDAADIAFTKAWKLYLEWGEHRQYEEQPLQIFRLYLEDMMRFLWDNDDSWDSWLICRNAFFEDLKPKKETEKHFYRILDLENSAVQDAIRFLKETEDMHWDAEEEEIKRYFNRVKNAACYLWKRSYLDTEPKESADVWNKIDADENYQNCSRISVEKGIDLYSLKLLVVATDQLLEENDRQYVLLHRIRQEFLNYFYTAAVKRWNKYIEHSRIRGGGRYLGIDEETEENRRGFTDYICSKMHDMAETVIDNMDEAIDMYCEETSDIYMYTMLNLTPFGYLNFMTYNLPSALGVIIDKGDALRLLAVLRSVSEPVEKEPEEGRMFRCFALIGKEIRMNLKKLLRYYQGELVQLKDSKLRIALKRKDTEYSDGWQFELSDTMFQISKGCEDLRTDLYDNRSELSEKEKLLGELLHYQYLSNILCVLIDFYFGDNLEDRGYDRVEEDLKYGFEAWKKLRKEMESRRCWKYCMEIGRLLNSPYLKYTEEKENIMDRSIAFLQEMHYQNKIRCGYQMLFYGKEEKVGDI